MTRSRSQGLSAGHDAIGTVNRTSSAAKVAETWSRIDSLGFEEHFEDKDGRQLCPAKRERTCSGLENRVPHSNTQDTPATTTWGNGGGYKRALIGTSPLQSLGLSTVYVPLPRKPFGRQRLNYQPLPSGLQSGEKQLRNIWQICHNPLLLQPTNKEGSDPCQ